MYLFPRLLPQCGYIMLHSRYRALLIVGWSPGFSPRRVTFKVLVIPEDINKLIANSEKGKYSNVKARHIPHTPNPAHRKAN